MDRQVSITSPPQLFLGEFGSSATVTEAIIIRSMTDIPPNGCDEPARFTTAATLVMMRSLLAEDGWFDSAKTMTYGQRRAQLQEARGTFPAPL